MPKKVIFIVGILVLVLGGLVVFKQIHKSKEPLLGIKHPNQGQQHIQRGEKHAPYNSDPASSGPHYNDEGAPTAWGIYTAPVPQEVYVHNEEHGGVVITYNPKLLPADQLKKLQGLFSQPSSNKDFSASKYVVTPRPEDTHAIELAAWTYTLNLDTYDEATIIKFYQQHAGHSPEPLGGPNTPPINQAAGS